MDNLKNIDPSAMHRLTYGLFVLTSREGGRDNGCIINTAMQVSDSPALVSFAVNKSNLTHDMIRSGGIMCISVLTQKAPFSVFRHFGFQSGRSADKFADCAQTPRAENGVIYVPEHTCAYIGGEVLSMTDCSTHTLFVARVTQAEALSQDKPMSYEYYFANVKPKPAAAKSSKKRFECRICGYICEDGELDDDFVCPICGHGADSFAEIV